MSSETPSQEATFELHNMLAIKQVRAELRVLLWFQGVGTTMPSPQTHADPHPKSSGPVGLTEPAQLDTSSTNLYSGSSSSAVQLHEKKEPRNSAAPELDRSAGT